MSATGEALETDRWQELDPVLIRGAQRSGTSIMGRLMRQLGIWGFGEGHLWFELCETFDRLRDPTHLANYRHEVYTLGEDRVELLERYVALAVDAFHRDQLEIAEGRWLDKSPGAEAVKAVPAIARMFPKSQIVFMYRNGIHNVHSALNKWGDGPQQFDQYCQAWTRTMSAWRGMRDGLEGRFLELAQERLASDPEGSVDRLIAFLGSDREAAPLMEFLRTNRVQTSFPDREPNDYDYEVDWSEERRRRFEEHCGDEMRAWGFDLDFRSSRSSAAAGRP